MSEHALSPPGDDLRRLVTLLRRRWIFVVVPVLAIGLAALGTGLQRPAEYQASALVEITDPGDLMRGAIAASNLDAQELATQVQLLQGEPVAIDVIEQLDLDISPPELLRHVRAHAIANARLLQVVVTGDDPAWVAQVAGAFADAYLDARRDEVEIRLRALTDLRQHQIEVLRERLDAIDEPDDPEAEAIAAQIAELTVSLTALPAEEALEDVGRLVRSAEVPTAPLGTSPPVLALIGAGLGLLVGVGLAVVRERLDATVRDETDAVELSGGMSVLGRVPVRGVDGTIEAREAELDAARRLHALLRCESDPPVNAVVVSGSVAGDGSSSVATSLAVAAARAGERVVLVEADMRRRSAIHRDDAELAGLRDVLAGATSVEDALHEAAEPSLRVLPRGTQQSIGPARLGSDEVSDLIYELRAQTDLVVLDAAPLFEVADTMQLARHVDAALLVTTVEVTPSAALRSAADDLQRTRLQLRGLVIRRGVRHTSALNV